MVDYSSYPMDAYAWSDPSLDPFDRIDPDNPQPYIELTDPRFVISVEWTWPEGDWSHFSIVRSVRSPVTRREEGQVMMETKGRTWYQFAHQTTGLPVYRDPQPPPGEWVYYTAFVLDPNRVWRSTGFVTEMSIADYDWALRLPEILPGVAVADQARTSSPADSSNDLVQFLLPPGALLDKVVSMGESAQYFWDPLKVPAQMLQAMTESLGHDYDEALGIGRFRHVMDALMGSQQGSLESIESFAEGATGCDARVEISNNLMIDTNDSSFENGTLVGTKWVPSANIELRKFENWTGTVAAGSNPTLHPNVKAVWYAYFKVAGTYTCGPNYTGTAPNTDVVTQGIPVANWTNVRMGLHAYKPSTAYAAVSCGLRFYDYLGRYLKNETYVSRAITQQWAWNGSGDAPIPLGGKRDEDTGAVIWDGKTEVLKDALWWVDSSYYQSGRLVDLTGGGRDAVFGAGTASPLILGHTSNWHYVYFPVREDSVGDQLGTPALKVTANTMRVYLQADLRNRTTMNTQFAQVGDATNGWIMYLTPQGYVGSRRFGATTPLPTNSGIVPTKTRNRFTHTTSTGNTVWEHSDDAVTWTTVYTFAHGTCVPSTWSHVALGSGSGYYSAGGSRYQVDVTLDGVMVHQMKVIGATFNDASTTIPNTGTSGGVWTLTRAVSGFKATIVDRPLLLFGGAQHAVLPEVFPTAKAVTYLFSYRRYGTPTVFEGVYDTGRSTSYPPTGKSGVISMQRTDPAQGLLLSARATDADGVGRQTGTFVPTVPNVVTTAIRVEPNGQASMFVDGAQVAAGLVEGWNGEMANPLVIGANYSATDVISSTGSMAFVAAAVWDRALTNEEISTATMELNSVPNPGFAYAVPFVVVSNPCSVDLIVVDDG